MSRKRVFVPVVTTFMAADPFIHGTGSKVQYKISYGHELENENLVFKIQMIKDGYIKGRQAPSYSDKDFEKIILIKQVLKQEYDKMDHRLRDIELSEKLVNQSIKEIKNKV